MTREDIFYAEENYIKIVQKGSAAIENSTFTSLVLSLNIWKGGAEGVSPIFLS